LNNPHNYLYHLKYADVSRWIRRLTTRSNTLLKITLQQEAITLNRWIWKRRTTLEHCMAY
jgi:hypothetical protein